MHLLARKGFLFCIQLFICVSWFADEAASPPSLPPSLLPVHTRSLQCEVGSWECPGCCSVLGCSWTKTMLKLRYPILGSLISFRALFTFFHCICVSPPETFLPLLTPEPFAGNSRVGAHKCQRPLFLGGSRGEQRTALHRGPWQSQGGTRSIVWI